MSALATTNTGGQLALPDFSDLVKKAEYISKSGLLPDAYRNQPANVMIALDISNRLGVAYLAVCQNLAIVRGKPCWSSSFIISLINSSGKFTPLTWEWKGKEGTEEWSARCVAKHLETGTVLEGSWVSLALAKAEGWSGVTGSKWKTMPEQMLRYRSATFWANTYAKERLLGLPDVDEVRDSNVSTRAETVASVESLLDVGVKAVESLSPEPPVIEVTPEPVKSRKATQETEPSPFL